MQGVGFRPFVYRMATACSLSGYVLNDGEGVTVEIEGPKELLERFIRGLHEELPPLARLDSVKTEEMQCTGERSFKILASDTNAAKKTAVSPDVTVCEACLKEMRDPANRRYRYPFINCTDCGPRYTIMLTVPYDRPNTSMARFAMCPQCRKEYEDPASRRYHAQPISCFDCGPRLRLLRRSAKREAGSEEPIEAAALLLKEGKIVAVKGLGGFHLMCDATNDEAVQRLRERKRRPGKPFAVMVKEVEMAKKVARVGEMEERLLTSKERPIVLMEKASRSSLPAPRLSDAVAPAIDRIGLMLPYTPLHHLLFDHIDVPLVATSANLSDEPIITEAAKLMEKLGHVVDAVLDHDRQIVNACDDSVVQVVAQRPQWLRVARGIAPMTMRLSAGTDEKILAVGANQKDTIALAFDDKIVLSPHIGDLNSIEAMDYFERTVETFKRFYDFIPDTVVHDRHPLYETTKWAKNLHTAHSTLHTHSVQHHYAHALAVMAEYPTAERVLAFVWDGTGYGEDGTIWGGEVFVCDLQGFERVAFLAPFRLIGGEKSVREPRRCALSLLFECFDLQEILALDSPSVAAFSPDEIRLLHRAWQKGINAPVTTSMGRLFDAVASLAGICQYVSYEGESGLRMEAAVRSLACEPLPMEVGDGTIGWAEALRAMVGERPESIPGRFMASLVRVITATAEAYPDLPIVLSGGVFQNRTLYEAAQKALTASDRVVLHAMNVPPNDGSIALGQIYGALKRKRRV